MKLLKSNFIIAVLATSFLLIGYSCTSEQYDLEEDLDEVNLKSAATTRSIQGDSRVLLMDSISESDEFLDYVIAVKALFKKSDEYFSTLSKKERAKLRTAAMLNNVEGNKGTVEYLALYENLKNEMNVVANAARTLRENKDYLKLNNNELSVVFSNQFIVSEKKLRKKKVPEEVLQRCAKIRDEKYVEIETEAAKAYGECLDIENELDCMECKLGVIVARNKKMDRANEEYEDCIKG